MKGKDKYKNLWVAMIIFGLLLAITGSFGWAATYGYDKSHVDDIWSVAAMWGFGFLVFGVVLLTYPGDSNE